MTPPAGASIDVYSARVGDPPIAYESLRALLNSEERARVARFRRPEDRTRQTVAAGVLRAVLAGRTGRDPAALRFHRDAYGKPRLDDGPPFNLSHSGDWVLIGVAPEGRVGVDVEAIRPLSDLQMLATRTFAKEEVAALLEVPLEEQTRAFFRVWTRKEAYLKALGTGLYTDLASFRVSVAPAPATCLLHVDDPSESLRPWEVRSIALEPGVEAAVAWDGGAFTVHHRPVPGLAPSRAADAPHP